MLYEEVVLKSKMSSPLISQTPPRQRDILYTYHYLTRRQRRFTLIRPSVSTLPNIAVNHGLLLTDLGGCATNHLKMAENRDTGPLPPGWDRKYDPRTGR
jgi:hypothetical protein